MNIKYKMVIDRFTRSCRVEWKPVGLVEIVHTGLPRTHANATYKDHEIFVNGKPAGCVSGGEFILSWDETQDTVEWPCKAEAESLVGDLASLLSDLVALNAEALERRRLIAALPKKAESDWAEVQPGNDYW